MSKRKSLSTGSRRSIADQIGEEPIDALTRRPSKAKRDRSWERRQQLVAYRGIPPELQEELKGIARKLGVTVGEVARTFLEYGLEAYEQGQLELRPVLTTGKHTLFPGGVSSRQVRKAG